MTSSASVRAALIVVAALLLGMVSLECQGTQEIKPVAQRQGTLSPEPVAVDFDCLPMGNPEDGCDGYNLDEVAWGIQTNVQYLQDASGEPAPTPHPNYDATARGNQGPHNVRYALTGWGAAVFYFWGHGWGNDVNGHGGGVKCGEEWLIAHRCANADNDQDRCRCWGAYVLPTYSGTSWSRCRLAVLSGCYTAYPLDSNGAPRDRLNDTEDGRHGNLTWELHHHGGIDTVLGFAGKTSYHEPCEVWATSFWQSLCQPAAAGFTDGIPRSVYWSAWHAKEAVYKYMDEKSYEGYDTYRICGNQNLRIVPVLKPRGTN